MPPSYFNTVTSAMKLCEHCDVEIDDVDGEVLCETCRDVRRMERRLLARSYKELYEVVAAEGSWTDGTQKDES